MYQVGTLTHARLAKVGMASAEAAAATNKKQKRGGGGGDNHHGD